MWKERHTLLVYTPSDWIESFRKEAGFSQRSQGSISTRSSENDEYCGSPVPEIPGHGETIETDSEIDVFEKKNEKKIPNKIKQALNLPTLCNINPHSIYNKLDEFHEFIKEEEVDCIFLSESWERENLTLENVINLENHKVISNVNQRSGKGGRPALIVNYKKYEVEDLTNHMIQIPMIKYV